MSRSYNVLVLPLTCPNCGLATEEVSWGRQCVRCRIEWEKMPAFSTRFLPSLPISWPTYRKKVVTHALKINGPFVVETSEGPLRCEDGYLAVDARGYPYPIATEEFDLIYEEVLDE